MTRIVDTTEKYTLFDMSTVKYEHEVRICIDFL